jgi:hypothetical protein
MSNSHSDDDLKHLFETYANLNSKSSKREKSESLDNVKFIKLCKDTKIVGSSSLTTSEADIIYAKAVSTTRKVSRQMTFQNFEQAIHLVGEKLYPEKGAEEAFDILKSIGGRAERQTSTKSISKCSMKKSSSMDIVVRLTDTTQYTGTHKHRFDEHGNGLGLEGRDTISKTCDLASYVERKGGIIPTPKAPSLNELDSKGGKSLTQSLDSILANRTNKPNEDKFGLLYPTPENRDETLGNHVDDILKIANEEKSIATEEKHVPKTQVKLSGRNTGANVTAALNTWKPTTI